MKKALLCLLALLLIISVSACASKQPAKEEQPQTPGEEEILQPPDEDETIEQPLDANLMEINIFHLGIRTPLETQDINAAALARQFAAMLENAAETDSMDAPPESALNPIQVMSGHTALELIYKQETELPLKIDGEPLLAHRLLFSIPLSSSEGGLLYIGQEIYEETPQGLLFDQALQNAIFNNASDQVERVTFAADGSEVLINGQTYPYDKGGVDTGLSGRLLDRILYRTIAFYLNAYTGNVNGLQAMSTATLYEGVLRAHAGLDTDYDLGEDIIAKFNKYILSDYVLPQAILAPVRQGEEYQTALRLNESITVEIYFTAEEDLPLVSALKLVVAEDDAGNAEDAEDIINI